MFAVPFIPQGDQDSTAPAHIEVLGDWNTWTGLGADEKASTVGNWANGSIADDDMLAWLGNVSNKNCTFDVDGSYAGFILDNNYSGNVTMKVNITSDYTRIDCNENLTDMHDFNLWSDANLTWNQTGDYRHTKGYIPTHIFNIVWDDNLTFYQEAVTSQIGEHGMIGAYGWVANHWTVKSGHELQYYVGGLIGGADGGGALNMTIEANAILTILPSLALYPCLTYPGVSDYQNTPYFCKYNFTNLGLIQSPDYALGSALYPFVFDGVAQPLYGDENITWGNITCPIICNNIYGGNWTLYTNYPTGAVSLSGWITAWGEPNYIQGNHDWDVTGSFKIGTIGNGVNFFKNPAYEVNVSGDFWAKYTMFWNGTFYCGGDFWNIAGDFYQNGTLICVDFINTGYFHQNGVIRCDGFTFVTGSKTFYMSGDPIIVGGTWYTRKAAAPLPVFSGTSPIIMTGSGKTLRISTSHSFSDLTIESGASITLQCSIPVTDNFVVNGTMDLAGFAINNILGNATFKNNFTFAGGTFVAGTSIVCLGSADITTFTLTLGTCQVYMNGTGSLKTDGTSPGGFLDLHLDGNILLLSDVWVNGNYSNKGTVWYNGFRIYNNGTYYDGIPPPSGAPPISSDFSYYYGSSGQVFFNSQSPGAVSWSWDFGDGFTSTLQNPSRTYASTGNYTVTLRVTDGMGNYATASKNVAVVVPSTPSHFDDTYVMIGIVFVVAGAGLLYLRSRR